MNTTQTQDLEVKYMDQAVSILNEIEAGIKNATGLNCSRRTSMGAFYLDIEGSKYRIIINHDLAGYSAQRRDKTGNSIVRLLSRGRNTHFRMRSDGTYNIQKIVDDVAAYAASIRLSEDAKAKSIIASEENERLMTAELGVIELPQGVRIHRDPMNGIYLITTSGGGRFPDLTTSEATEVLALLKKYRFEGRSF